MVSVCLPPDALLQHLPSYLGFSYLGCGVSLHGCSSAVTAPYLGWGVSPYHHPSWPWTWSSSSRPSCARAAAAPWTWGCSTSCEELTHWKRLWCWEGLRAVGKGDDRGWDGWMASPTRWTWVCMNSGSWWWTGRPGVLWFMGSTESDTTERLNWTELKRELIRHEARKEKAI